MSRKYCDSCGIKHSNGGLGMCDPCLEAEGIRIQNERAAAIEAREEFMNLSDEEKWDRVYEVMLDHGWEP